MPRELQQKSACTLRVRNSVALHEKRHLRAFRQTLYESCAC
jgi:hypothetical protein